MAILALILVLLGLGSAGADGGFAPGGVDVVETGCGKAETEVPYELYSTGSRFGDLELSTVLVNCRGGGEGKSGSSMISYIYGDCQAPLFTEGGCAPPLEIQNNPACGLPGGRPLTARATKRMRGVPVVRSGGGLEIHTGRTSVVIFSSGVKVTDAARALRRDPASNRPADLPESQVEADGKLPAPEAGLFDCPVR